MQNVKCKSMLITQLQNKKRGFICFTVHKSSFDEKKLHFVNIVSNHILRLLN
jgi:hypothetical protein